MHFYCSVFLIHMHYHHLHFINSFLLLPPLLYTKIVPTQITYIFKKLWHFLSFLSIAIIYSKVAASDDFSLIDARSDKCETKI